MGAIYFELSELAHKALLISSVFTNGLSFDAHADAHLCKRVHSIAFNSKHTTYPLQQVAALPN